MVMVAHLRADGHGHGGSVTSTEIAAHALFRCEYCKLISQSDLMGVHRYRTCTGLGAPIVSADSCKEGFGRPKPDLFLPPQLTPPRWAFLSKEAQ